MKWGQVGQNVKFAKSLPFLQEDTASNNGSENDITMASKDGDNPGRITTWYLLLLFVIWIWYYLFTLIDTLVPHYAANK